MSDDMRFMHRALALARRGLGRVEPNPMVGAVLVKHGTVVAEGWHRRFGGPHAEIECLRNAPPGDVRGSTMLVTLEPCCHIGKTGPCTQTLIDAGIKRVVVAMIDPSPHAAGKGIEQLRAAGVEVTVGVCEAEARELTAPFIKRVTTGLPWVIAKWAQTIDGKIATSGGDSKWISGEASRRIVHELRARVDAIMVGVGTVILDDPQLTARDVPVRRLARRVIVDPQQRTPASAKVRSGPPETIFLTRDNAPELPDLRGSLQRLAADGATNILVEGGATLLGHLFAQDLVDELIVFIAPKLLGDSAAIDAVCGLHVAKIVDSRQLTLHAVKRVGDDVMVTYRR